MSRFVATSVKPLVMAASFAIAATANATIAVQPDCPAPDDVITISAIGPEVQREALSLELQGTTIRLVAQAFHSGFSLPPFTEVVGTLSPLSPGKYHIEFYTRIQPNGMPGGDPANLLPAQFSEAKDFEVYQLPPTCAAANVESIGVAFTSAVVNEPYPETLRLKVTDSHGNPVPDFALRLQRVKPPSEPSNNDPVPDFAQAPTFITTGPDGIASLAGEANQVAGAFQYQALILHTTYATFYNQPVASSAPTNSVVEFVRSMPDGMQHFFMTGNGAEVANLDRSPDWRRTGAVFMAFAPGSNRPGTTSVCRFYGLPSAGLDSHFFSAAPDECEAVAQRFANAWELESTDAFEVFLPDRDTGSCPPGTRKLYRAYNNQPDANHRYALTHDVALLNAHPANGPYWSLEGYGEDSVVMCLPQ